VPAAGCYDAVGTSTADYFYNGVPNVVANTAFHGSGDGTCSGLLAPSADLTTVVARTQAEAIAMCGALGRGVAWDWVGSGFPTFGPNAFWCSIAGP
jgi:hypothetical protein